MHLEHVTSSDHMQLQRILHSCLYDIDADLNENVLRN